MALPLTQTKSRSVLGATELTLMAPIKRGLIPALDSRSYQTRAKLVLDTLHALGVSRREIDPTPAIAEVADSIRSIRSFRLAIAGAEQKQLQPQVILSVSFDGGWEPYIRRIWHPLGPLLDLIFCNCEGYLLSSQHDFQAYAGWVRQAQVETSFYYEDSPLTVADLQLLRKLQGLPDPAPAAPAGSPEEQARAAMVAFYRLSDMHPALPDNEDGVVLRRAARLLLCQSSDPITTLPPPTLLRTPTEEAAWNWFCKGLPPSSPNGAPNPLPLPRIVARRSSAGAAEAINLANVQSGILEPHPDIQHGRLVLVGLDETASVSRLIAHLAPKVVAAGAPVYRAVGPMFVNLAFTYAGLVLAGVDAGTLEQMPQEFKEGMEARAGILGDWEANHPLHWTLPQGHGATTHDPVELSTVHVVVSFWRADDRVAELDQAVADLLHALGNAGRVVVVQEMQRIKNAVTHAIEGHFGFADAISQPGLAAAGRPEIDEVLPGELLLGYRNDRNDVPLKGRLWDDSSFLVVRKLRQDVAAFRGMAPTVQAKLMGRHANGTNLAGASGNDFDYTADPDGRTCPLYAHVRRANPRTERPNELDHLPRIVRRGMSYGPAFSAKTAHEERGLVFMAYNASIAEQFEVIQGWLAGRNSAGPDSFSGLRDPILGVARAGDPRRYVWASGSVTHAVTLPANPPLVRLEWGLYAFAPSLAALTELRLLADEGAAEDRIDDMDSPAPGDDPQAVRRKRDRRDREQAGQAAFGSALIARLQQAEQALGFDAAVDEWKVALEDVGRRMSGASRAIWTAVRHAHGGALRTPYGVLVCSKPLVQQVLENADGKYTVSGYNARLGKSFGEIYLGRDAGKRYRDEADPANRAIMAVTQAEAFDSAHGHTVVLLKHVTRLLTPKEDVVVEVKDLVDDLLSRFCFEWFGLPDRIHVQPGGWHWHNEATCPGHFHSPSRYTFQPQPGPQAKKVGEEHGLLLKQQVLSFVKANRTNPKAQGRLGRALFEAFAISAKDEDGASLYGNAAIADERLASNLIGVMMGFLPTVDGNLRGALFEWVRDRSLWDHQAALRAAKGATIDRAAEVLRPELERAMQLRPVPELVWRTALRDDKLGALEVRAGDTVVVSIVSATQDDLLNNRNSGNYLKTDPLSKEMDPSFVVFGGRREPPSGVGTQTIPTHACPGYAMAMGVMLGFLAGLMDTVTLRPGTSPMALRIGPR